MTSEGMSPADVAAVVDRPYNGYNGGLGGFGGDATWLVILFLFAAMGGWGNGFGGNNGCNGWALASNTDNLVTNGFNQAATANTLSSIQNSVNNGFASAEIAGCNRAMDAMQTAYQNQIADLNRSFAAQTANTAALNGIQAQLADCCCGNKAAIADLKYTVATEACADRAAVSNALRDVLTANTASTQRILDQICQDKIDAKNDLIAQLRQELMFARGQASQDVQTAALRAGQVEEVDALYNRLSNCPVPSVPVYGRQPIFTCGNGATGCGCGAM